MTDPVNDAELERRVASAMQRLADSHEPTPLEQVERARTQGGLRWLSVAAVFALLAVGIGGLIFALQSNESLPDQVSPANSATLPTTPAAEDVSDPSVELTEDPATDTEDSTPTTEPSLSDGARLFRFDEAIPDSIVAGLSPAPGGTGTLLLTEQRPFDAVSPLLDTVTIASLDTDGEPTGFVAVTDTLIPPSVFPEAERTTVGSITYANLPLDDSTLAVIDNDRVRYVNAAAAAPSEDELTRALAVAQFIAGTELDDIRSTADFELVPAFDSQVAPVQYPLTSTPESGRLVEVVASRSTEAIDDRALQLIAMLLATDVELGLDGVSYSGQHPYAGQPVYVEQVSPVDIIVMMGPPDMTSAQLDDIVATLSFGSSAELGLEVEDLRLDQDLAVALQSDEPWGRWAMYTSDADGERCFGLDVYVWPSSGSGAFSIECVPLDESASGFPAELCHPISNSTFVLVVTTDPALEVSSLVGASQHEFEGLTLTATLYDNRIGGPIECNR